MRAVALVNPILAKSQLCGWLETRCGRAGVKLDVHVIGGGNRSEYNPMYDRYTHIISGEFGKTAQSRKKAGKNVLWIANSLINPPSGIFVDGGGYFTESNLCRHKGWKLRNNANIERAAAKLGWTAFGGGDPSGPLLVTMQVRDDMALRHFFPLGKGKGDPVVTMLTLLRDHLPRGRKVLIRPHPNEIKRARWSNGGIWRDDWMLDGGGTLRERLPCCSGVIAVNSSCVSEALLLGVPVATLGVGAFTGHRATFECHSNPARLAHFLDWPCGLMRGRAYVNALLGSHFLPYDAAGADCEEFDQWLRRANQG